ncbi:MAG: antibiotic biosynthesis monooxygenase [Alphaproteobacteria bacterium]|nr:antibiotic biosynthesis monooxygenase [Alphaproteobacteria bacterium]
MFLVVFRNRERADIDASGYAVDAERMEWLAAAQPGYVSFKSYVSDGGEVIALSEWDSEAAARGWAEYGDHLAVQCKGQAESYENYAMFACVDPRIHRFDGSEA